MVYVGVDLHRKRSHVVALDPAGAVLDGLDGSGAAACRRMQVDRAACVAVLCGLHGSYSLVRGIRGKRYKYVLIQSMRI